MKNPTSEHDVLVIFSDKGFGLKNTEFVAKKKVRFSGKVEEGVKSIVFLDNGDDVGVVYCEKTAKHFVKLFEEDSSVKF